MNFVQQSQSANRAHLHAAIDAWNQGRLDDYLTLYDDSVLLHGYAPQPMTKPEVTGFYRATSASLRQEGGGPPTLDIDILMETADQIGMRFSMSGNHMGPFLGYPPTGKPYVTTGLTVLRFADGKVVERWSSVDMLGLLVQTGSVALPATT